VEGKTHYERPARTLVLAVATLCALVLALTIVDRFAFDRSMRQTARDIQTLTASAELTTDGVRVKDDAIALNLAPTAPAFAEARRKLRFDLGSMQAAHGDLASDKQWHGSRSLAQNYAALVSAATELARAPSADAARPLTLAVSAAAAPFDSDMRTADRSYAGDVNELTVERLLLFGARVPSACAFLIVAVVAVLLPPALRRIRSVNETLINLEAASARQATELAERNMTLQAQQATLRNSEAELIMKTEQLESTSLGSQQAARRFEELFQGLPVACIGFSVDGRVFEWNRSSNDMFGREAYQVLHEKLWPHVAVPSFARRGSAIIRGVFRGKEYRNVEWQCTAPDGHRRQILGHFFPMRGVDGRILGGVAACLDVTDRLEYEEKLKSHANALAAAHQELKARQSLLETANARLEALAVTDGLTGLFNHRALQERLDEEIAHAPDSLSLVMIDVDHFKLYNDAFGHPEGDSVLRSVAAMLTESVRPGGVTARYGGEEFAILLPGYDAVASRAFAEDLCKAVAVARWPHRSITISAGVATLSPECLTPAALIRAADEALYESKRNGRNRSTHANASRRAA